MVPKNEIYALCYTEQFNFNELLAFMLDHFRCTAYRKVLNVEWKQGQVFIFDYGVVVFWQTDAKQRFEFLQKLQSFAENPIQQLLEDEFTFEFKADKNAIKNDHIYLVEDDVMTRLAISHGVAQSTKLAQFESQVQQTINETAYIPQNIADSGNSRLSGKELAKLRGRLFLSKSNIMLNYDLLDVPDFFWEFPELEGYYRMVSDYLEIKQRLDVLSKKLETIHELLVMMAEEQKHHHSSVLEWIVIGLIAFEVFMTIYHEVLKHI